jgi:hypothetical protein
MKRVWLVLAVVALGIAGCDRVVDLTTRADGGQDGASVSDSSGGGFDGGLDGGTVNDDGGGVPDAGVSDAITAD